MELKSNIRIKSNLYIRSTEDGNFSFADEGYIAQIKNRAALEKLTLFAEKSGAELKLSDIQKNILGLHTAETLPTQNNESAAVIPEAAPIIEESESEAALPIAEEPDVQLEKIDIGLDKFSEIGDSETKPRIIEAGLDSKIILDSVCFSEKIQIAAERTAFILKNNPGKRLLVLCKTEIAADRIRTSAKEKLSDGSYIDALDVFAAKYLADSGESVSRICALSENEKIALFNDKMRTEDFSDYDFCIIADLDELVFEHVKTVLKILVLLKCGFLLMSNKRRAALRYAPDSGYAKNFAKLRDVLPENIERLSLGIPKHVLSDEIESLMLAVTEGKPSDDICRSLLSKMETVDISALASVNDRAVVLCKDGSCAEYVNHLLHENGIPHVLIQEGRTAPVRYLADILWDSHEKIMGRDNFIKRYAARCGSDEGDAGKRFNELCVLTERAPSDGLEISRLAKVISLKDMPLELMNGSNVMLAVAEIGSAHSKEYDKVYLVGSDFNQTPDSKLLYLAAAGRTTPPAVLKLGSAPNSAESGTNRRVYIDGDGKPAFSAGCPGDIDLSSFIGGSVGDAVRKQAYISKNVKPGDSVTLKLNGKVYDIVHNNTVIGRTSSAFSESLTAEFGGQRYFDPLPEQIIGVHVTDVITVVSVRDPSEYEGVISPQFRDHRFWYGVEISGFGKAE